MIRKAKKTPFPPIQWWHGNREGTKGSTDGDARPLKRHFWKVTETRAPTRETWVSVDPTAKSWKGKWRGGGGGLSSCRKGGGKKNHWEFRPVQLELGEPSSKKKKDRKEKQRAYSHEKAKN